MRSVGFNGVEVTACKVVCIGRNYVEHIEELGNEIPETMVVFTKPNSAITSTLRYFTPYTRFEGEICFLIRSWRIAGVGFGLDLTHAHIQERLKAKGLPWERAKAFDGSAVLSEFVAFDGDVNALRMTLTHNDRIVQSGGVERMIYKPDVMIKEIRRFMSLEDNDIVMSGTPKGVGTYGVGDRFVGRVYEGNRLLLEASWTVQDEPTPLR